MYQNEIAMSNDKIDEYFNIKHTIDYENHHDNDLNKSRTSEKMIN